MTETAMKAAETAAAKQPTAGKPKQAKPDVDPLAALNAALAAAQGEFEAIPRSSEVTVKTKDGGSYTFKYASLDAILTAVRPALSKHGLAVTQLLLEDGGRLGIRTELRHADGALVGAFFPLLSMPATPQQLGSLLTYLRRYAIVALLGVASDQDDDGGQAADAPPAAKPKMITDKQRGRLWEIVRARNIDEAVLRDIVYGVTGDKEGSTKTLTVAQYDQIVAVVEAEDVPF